MYWYDGSLISSSTIQIPIDEPGLLYGATVFTTLRVYEQSLHHPLTHWEAHCDRLRYSISTLRWTEPNWMQLQQGAEELAPHFPVLRVTLFSDGREWITGRSLPSKLSQWQQDGITAWVAEPAEQYGRSLPHLKTGNYLTPWLARRDAQQQQAQEAILIDSEGYWLETSTGTLWGWGAGSWWTPPLSAGILPGIARSHLITQLKCQNERVREEPWSREVIAKLEAIAYSNAVVQVVPIHTVLGSGDARVFTPKHPSIRTLIAQFERPPSPDF